MVYRFSLFTSLVIAGLALGTPCSLYGQTPVAGKVAFSSLRADQNNEIFLMNVDGTDVRRLTYHAGADTRPALSADGSKLAFVSNRDSELGQETEIYTINVDGTGLTRITHTGGRHDYPVWSPDGSQLAFFAQDPSDNIGRIYKIDATGLNPTPLVEGYDYYLAWANTPGGEKISYHRTTAGPGGGSFVAYLVNPDGSNPAPSAAPAGGSFSADGTKTVGISYDGRYLFIVYNASSGAELSRCYLGDHTIFPERVVFSADGQKLICAAYAYDFAANTSTYEIFSVNLNGTGFVRLTNTATADLDPSCAPGLTVPVTPAPTGFGRIVFSRNGDLYTVYPTGWGLKNLTNIDNTSGTVLDLPRSPVWSPDGTRIAFRNGNRSLSTMAADGSDRRLVLNAIEGGYVNELAWSASGLQLAYVGKNDASSAFYHERIYVANLDGSNPHLEAGGTIAPDPDRPGFFILGEPVANFGMPSWNPNVSANQIAYWRGGPHFESTIAVKTVGAPPESEQRLISNGTDTDPYTGTFYSHPVWNPAGTKLAFVKRKGSPDFTVKQDIMLMNADGLGVLNLTNHNFGDSQDDYPTFSPDGQRIAFTRGSALFTMNLDGTQVSQVMPADGSNSAAELNWGANSDGPIPDSQSPVLTIINPANGASTARLQVQGTTNDPGSDNSGVAVVWLALQRLADQAFWNPATETWTATPALLPARVLETGSVVSSPVLPWTATSLDQGGSLPNPTELAAGQYQLSGYAVDNAGNASPLTQVPFSVIKPGAFEFQAPTYSLRENGGPISPGAITVLRTNGSDGAVSVDYTIAGFGDGTNATPGSATPDLDYTGSGGTLSFGPGETSKTITFSPVNDTEEEPSEVLYLTLTNPTNGADLGGSPYATINLLDDDTPPPANAPVVNSPLSASAKDGRAFTYSIKATKTPTSFAASGLPAGLQVNATTGLISGTPTESGSFNVLISATNANGTGNATLVLAIAVEKRADLSGRCTNLTVVRKANGNLVIKGILTMTNIGTKAALNFKVKPYLSTDASLEPATDLKLGGMIALTGVPGAFTGTKIPSLAKQVSIGPLGFKLTVPADFTGLLEGKYVLLSLDHGSVVPELNEDNNLIVIGPLTP